MGIKCPKCQHENLDTQKFCGECATPLPTHGEVSVTKTLETQVKSSPKDRLLLDDTRSLKSWEEEEWEEYTKGGCYD
jgi:uncharacterized OB-fold protein